MTMMKPLALAAALCVAPVMALADGWSYASDVCRDDRDACVTNVLQSMAVELYLRPGQTLEELDALNENIELEPGMDIPPRVWIRRV